MTLDSLVLAAGGLVSLPWWGYVVVTLVLTHITIASVTINGKELPIHVYSSGAITAAGAWTEKTVGGLDHVTIDFPKGKLFVSAGENLRWQADVKACLGKARGGTTWKVTGGSGAYRGATGGGTYTDGGTLLGARAADGTCLGRKAAPPYVLVTGDFVGTLVIPTR